MMNSLYITYDVETDDNPNNFVMVMKANQTEPPTITLKKTGKEATDIVKLLLGNDNKTVVEVF